MVWCSVEFLNVWKNTEKRTESKNPISKDGKHQQQIDLACLSLRCDIRKSFFFFAFLLRIFHEFFFALSMSRHADPLRERRESLHQRMRHVVHAILATVESSRRVCMEAKRKQGQGNNNKLLFSLSHSFSISTRKGRRNFFRFFHSAEKQFLSRSFVATTSRKVHDRRESFIHFIVNY